jgi:hypothetical protein
MHWGVHKASPQGREGSRRTAKINAKIAQHENNAKIYRDRAKNIESHMKDLGENGLNAKVMRDHYGKTLNLGEGSFYLIHGKSKAMALREKTNEVIMAHNSHIKAAERNEKSAASLRAKLEHSDFDTEAFLAHHGVKGMHWGVRNGRYQVGPKVKSEKPAASADHKTVTGYKERVKAGGVKSLSNHELQALVSRMNLEQQHRDLVGKQPNKFDKGHGHIKKVLGVTKTVQDVYNLYNSPLGKAVVKGVKDYRNR